MIVASRNFGLEVEKKIEKNIIEENNDTDDNFTMILNNLRGKDVMLKPVMIDNMVIGNKIENTENQSTAENTENIEKKNNLENIEETKEKQNTDKTGMMKIMSTETITLTPTIDNEKHDSNDSDNDNNDNSNNIDRNNENIKIEIEMKIMTALVPFGDMLNHERPRQVRGIFFEDNK